MGFFLCSIVCFIKFMNQQDLSKSEPTSLPHHRFRHVYFEGKFISEVPWHIRKMVSKPCLLRNIVLILTDFVDLHETSGQPTSGRVIAQ